MERQIREGMELGAFDDLPHQGMPLPLEDDSAAGEWALAHRMLRNAAAVPPWIGADKQAREEIERLERLLERAAAASPTSHPRLRAEATNLVEMTNHAIERLNSEAPTNRQHRPPVDLQEVLRRLDEAFGR